jgi:hypothetical protein
MICAFKREYVKVQEVRRLVLQVTMTERGTGRMKRAIFNLAGHVAHPLSRKLDFGSEAFYNQTISQLEEVKLDWLKLIREQTIVVRSTLKPAIQNLHDMSTIELILTWEIHKILKFVNVGNKKIENKLHLLLYR